GRAHGLSPEAVDRMARRILKMGDLLTLIERAKKSVDSEKFRSEFTIEDFRNQMREVEKLGTFSEILKLIPGGEKMMGTLPPSFDSKKEFKRQSAIIDSMTPQERENIDVLNGRRRLRIASGSGTQVSQVNKLIKQFLEAKKMMKKMSRFGTRRDWRELKWLQ
ncbi:MAG: signal recognition particle protein, partial [Deltaproteobacteria bacterium]